MVKWTHKKLVDRGAIWLKQQRCTIIVKEFYLRANEYPDLLGFKQGLSKLIECKVTRADFFADNKKWFRELPECGMGHSRFFLVPEGLVTMEELPLGWNLLEACRGNSGFIHINKTLSNVVFNNRNFEAESWVIQSILRRAKLSIPPEKRITKRFELY